MRVLGIDPGTAACGYAIVHESDGRLRALDHGWFKTPAGERPELRLKTIFERVQGLVEAFEPAAVAMEESFVGAEAVCGYGRAEKAQVSLMVQAILSLHTPPSSSHAADALAVAICHALAPPLLKVIAS